MKDYEQNKIYALQDEGVILFSDYDNTEANEYGIGSYFYICVMSRNESLKSNIEQLCDSLQLNIIDYNIEVQEDSIDIVFQDVDKLRYAFVTIDKYLSKIEQLENCLKLEV